MFTGTSLTAIMLAAGGFGGGSDAEATGPATAGDWLLLLFYLGLALLVSFLCSLLEAGFLSLPRSHVRVMADEGHRWGVMLTGMKDSVDRPLAAIITLNTVSHTFGAAGVGAMIQKIFGANTSQIGFASSGGGTHVYLTGTYLGSAFAVRHSDSNPRPSPFASIHPVV